MGPRDPRPVGLVPRLSIDQLLWVANTRHGPAGHWFARVTEDREDHDHLRNASDAVDYLTRHHVPLPDVPPRPGDLRRLVTIREMVRGMLEPEQPRWPGEVLAMLAEARYAIEPGVDGGAIHGAAPGWQGFLDDLLLPLVELVERRDLRICGNPHCRLVFLDLSKNGSRRWCDTGGCGNRDRVKRYRGGRKRADARPSARADAPVTDGEPQPGVSGRT